MPRPFPQDLVLPRLASPPSEGQVAWGFLQTLTLIYMAFSPGYDDLLESSEDVTYALPREDSVWSYACVASLLDTPQVLFDMFRGERIDFERDPEGYAPTLLECVTSAREDAEVLLVEAEMLRRSGQLGLSGTNRVLADMQANYAAALVPVIEAFIARDLPLLGARSAWMHYYVSHSLAKFLEAKNPLWSIKSRE